MSVRDLDERIRARVPLPRWLVDDLVVLGPLAAVGAVAAGAVDAVPSALQTQAHQILTLLAVAGAVGAAITATIAGRIEADGVPLRIGAGLAVYGGLVLPLTAARFSSSIGPAGNLLDLLCLVSIAALVAVDLARRHPPVTSWASAAGAAATSIATAVAVMWIPPLVPTSAVLGAAFGVVLAVWFAIALITVGIGLRRDDFLARRTGIGIAVLVVAHAAAVLPGPDQPVSPAIAGLQLLGVAVVVTGVVPHARAALARQRAHDLDTAWRLQVAEQATREAERDAADRAHEMRNVVLGLAGATALLARPGSGHPDEEQTRLGAAMGAELNRLTEMLAPATPEARTDDTTFSVLDVLAVAVAVRRANGMRVDMDVVASLRVCGRPDDFAQVVTNILANCDRHAPGSAVHIRALVAEGSVVIEFRDQGPGLPPGYESMGPHRGSRSSVTGGCGLGLAISEELMRRQSGSLTLRSALPGCVVSLCLPATSPVGHLVRHRVHIS